MRNNRFMGNRRHYTFDVGKGIRKDLFPKMFKMWWFMAILMGIIILFILFVAYQIFSKINSF